MLTFTREWDTWAKWKGYARHPD